MLVKQATVIGASDTLVFDMLYKNDTDSPAQVYPCGIVRLSSGLLMNLSTGVISNKGVTNTCEIISTDHGFLIAEIGLVGEAIFSILKKDGSITSLSSVLKARKFLRSSNRLFAVTDTSLVEVSIKDFGKPLLVTLNAWQILSNSAFWFDGVGIQNSLGAMHLVLPFGEASCTYIPVPDLQGLKLVDAIAGSRYVVVVALEPKSGQYYKYTYCFDHDYKTYRLDKEMVDTPELNMAILPKGVCVNITNDEELLITVPMNGQRKEIVDKHIKTSFVLGTWENKIVFLHGNKVWAVRMKNP